MRTRPNKLTGSNFFSDAVPVHIGDSVFTPRSTFTAHTHDFYEFFIVRSGALVHHCNGESITIQPGTLWLILPADTHYFSTAADDDAFITNVAFPASIADAALAYLNIADPAAAIASHRHAALSPASFGYFIDRTQKLAAARPERKRMLLSSLVIDVLTECLADERVILPPAWLSSAVSAMQREENFSGGLERFIELAGKSQEHLSRTLSEYYGQTPTEFVNALRLDRAAYRMRTGTDDITDIAFAVGFNNSSHFIDLFKKRYGVTPSAYRRQSSQIFAAKT